MIVKPLINEREVVMEVDTGATVSIISNSTYHRLWPKGGGSTAPTLKPTICKLRTYTRQPLTTIGEISVSVVLNGQKRCLPLVVVDGEGPSLLGRDWMSQIRLDWGQLNKVCSNQGPNSTGLARILEKHSGVFKEELGCIGGTQAKIYVKPEQQPKFCRARNVPFTWRKNVEEELERLVDTGVILPVQHSEWATPIVPVVKSNGAIRICGDYKITLNHATIMESYPLPRIDDLVGTLAGGHSFSKIDLAHAYQQVQLEESSKKLTTINTH